MESIGYLYGLAAQDCDASAPGDCHLSALGPDALGDFVPAVDVKQAVTAASRHAVTLACGVSLVAATGSAALALRRGDSGVTVTQLQQDLAAIGAYDGPVTGFYGSLTEAAVQDFQVAQGLAVDGVAGANTIAAIQGPATAAPSATATGNPAVLAQGNRGAAVGDLQRALTTAGYYGGPVTSYYGTLTEAAVVRFQQASGLTADGIAGPITLAELAVAQSAPDVTVLNVAQPAIAPTPVQPVVVSTPELVGDVLYLGDRGQAVLSLQTQLANIGYYSRERMTGYYGSSTEAAVKRFQEASDLVVNGIAGPLTLEKLGERSARTP
ncbi:MAG: peptidoglycan-binding protein [Elainellaceae cyanobacterium]